MSLPISILARLSHAIDAFSEYTGRAVSWLTLLMVLITFLIVVLRYAFNIGWIAMQESVMYLHSVVFLVGASFTLKRNGHVRVDIYYREMSAQARARVDLFGTLLFLVPTCGFIGWSSWGYVMDAWAIREGSRETGGIPGVYLLKTVILVMAALVLLQGIAELLRSILVLAEPTPEEEG